MLEFIERLKEKARWSFCFRPQVYELSAEVILENPSAGTRDYVLVLPLPSAGQGQDILGTLELLPQPMANRVDALYNNRYAVFSGSIAPEESLIFRYAAKVSTQPRRIEPTQTFTFGDYSQLGRSLVAKWTASTFHTEARDRRVIRLAEEVKDGASDILSIVKKVNEYVIGRLRYGAPIDGLYTLDDVFQKDAVDCGGYDVLFVSLCHALGIPARIVSGFWLGHPTNSMHAWVEVLLPNGQWLPLDPSVEQLSRHGRTLKSGRLGFVGSDRLITSYGADLPIVIDSKTLTVDILQNPFLANQKESPDLKLKFSLRAKRT